MSDAGEIYQRTLDARRVLDGVARRTPLLPYRDGVHLKAESLQRSGSFKFRGAYYTIARMDRRTRDAGVVAYSTGNHAQSVALAAWLLGVRAHVVMSPSAPPQKVERTRAYGADVVMAEDSSFARIEAAEALARARGLGLVPPYDHPDVMAGQGTIAAEILEALPDAGTLVVPVGGGGLICGMAAYVRRARPGVRVVGAEPAGAADARQSLQEGRLVAWPSTRTVCDGLSVQQVGDSNFALMRELVDEIVAVDDGDVLVAMRALLLEAKLLVEPSGAIALAAVESGDAELPPPVVAVLTGGNVAPELVRRVLEGEAG